MIGCGNMGSALLKGWVEANTLGQYAEVIVQDISPPSPDRKINGVRYVNQLREITLPPALIVMATKPEQLEAVLAECKNQFGDAPIYFSIAAGKTIHSIQAVLGKQAHIVRAMPNTPAQIGAGVIGLSATENINASTRQQLTELCAPLGLVMWIQESQMDALTALSGSGPAYTYYFMECLAKAATSLGLSLQQADRLARYTIYGAGALAIQSDETLATLREKVTSKGGTTEAALKIWMVPGSLDKQAREALDAAAKRAREMAENK